MDQDMALSSNLGLLPKDGSWGGAGSTGHSDLYGRAEAQPWVPFISRHHMAWVIIKDVNIRTDSNYSWTMDLNMVLGNSLGIDCQ